MKPIVKWAGGKRQLLAAIKENLPNQWNGDYFEPFVGGGALFFELEPKKAFLNDINSELINLYKVFFDTNDVLKLMTLLKKHQKNHSKEYFYRVRAEDRKKNYINSNFIKRAARFIYLNKACFNGLYRVNSEGFFNVPFNQSKSVTLIDEKNFNEIHEYFSKNEIIFTSVDYLEALKKAKKGDFVYFDPPYDELEDKKSFTSYSKTGFSREDQKQLFDLFQVLTKRGVYCLLSNHSTEFIKNLYSSFNIIPVQALRSINSNKNDRKAITEVLIKNYL
jgi:DNA adenine methylase